jgi:hypothetical protein
LRQVFPPIKFIFVSFQKLGAFYKRINAKLSDKQRLIIIFTTELKNLFFKKQRFRFMKKGALSNELNNEFWLLQIK